MKPRGEDIQILRVARIIAAENRVGGMIGDLNQPGGSGVDKERGVGDVLQRAPSGANLPEQPSTGPEPRL